MWNIIFYEKENGSIPVQEFLDKLPVKHHAKALRNIDILEKYGTALTAPHVKHIQGKLWELRIKSAGAISRIFYFVPVGNDIILLHGFVKKHPKHRIGKLKQPTLIQRIIKGGTTYELQRI